ncbi:DUF2637 domain-containing protein [Actinoallomurus sp. NBC_01490]|uniref:DUF2637 domain-containing protein n=1 Tax=Actinoallomurus sp. NBC_01490 TaxID=2903557 RepID=UPI002E34817A|nr:DUF2637 domain-containing protein [Actinoallomurus sp. NBC_01490]
MAQTRVGGTDRAIRWTTILSVIVLAVIAALVSYKHMYLLVRRYGETSWTAALLPISVDGMIAASSMSLLLDSRYGRRSGVLPWALIIIGSAASLAANVAVAEPSAVGRLIAGWPSCALIGSYELLMGQIRHSAARETKPANPNSYVSHTTFKMPHASSNKSQTEPRVATAPSYGPLTNPGHGSEASEKVHADGVVDLIASSDEPLENGAADGGRVRRSSRQRASGRDAGVQQRAWQWAMDNRTPKGELPPGKAIASRFGRSERWGRLVKQAGLAGRLDTHAA